MTSPVLVVDDASTVRMFLEAVLSSVGFETVCARDGGEALELMAGGAAPSFALVDINMPGMDGYELVRRLRANPETSSLPIVMCSTESKPIDERRAYEAGANYYLRKPASKDVVRDLAALFAKVPENGGRP